MEDGEGDVGAEQGRLKLQNNPKTPHKTLNFILNKPPSPGNPMVFMMSSRNR